MSNLGIFGPEFEKTVVIFENHLQIVKVIVSQQKINC